MLNTNVMILVPRLYNFKSKIYEKQTHIANEPRSQFSLEIGTDRKICYFFSRPHSSSGCSRLDSVGFSPLANYIDRAIAAGQRS
jgi:hypothetical protein